MDNYNKYVQYGLSLNRNVGNSGRSCLETAFKTFWLFPEHYRFLYTLKPFPHIYLLKTVVWDMHSAPAIFVVFVLSAPFVCSSSWFHLLWSTKALHNTWLGNT